VFAKKGGAIERVVPGLEDAKQRVREVLAEG
jgi:hypothetical protein